MHKLTSVLDICCARCAMTCSWTRPHFFVLYWFPIPPNCRTKYEGYLASCQIKLGVDFLIEDLSLFFFFWQQVCNQVTCYLLSSIVYTHGPVSQENQDSQSISAPCPWFLVHWKIQSIARKVTNLTRISFEKVFNLLSLDETCIT